LTGIKNAIELGGNQQIFEYCRFIAENFATGAR
jgi:hypothetical protein